MNESQTTQITRLKAYLTERLEECKNLTDLDQFRHCLPWVDYKFMRDARTLAPILLANTLREIDFLLEFRDKWNYRASPEWSHFNDRLNEILEIFKEVLL